MGGVARKCGAGSKLSPNSSAIMAEPWFVLRRHTDAVNCVAAATLDGREVIISGLVDAAVPAFDLIDKRVSPTSSSHRADPPTGR